MSAAGEVVCEGWLRKSPPEKKLRRYAWKRRWFVLRSGRLSGEPDVLQYFKNQQARRPIRTINLNLCEQVDAGLTFTKKELESSFVFDLRTEERTWYLVAESEEDMNRWVSSICLLCGFNPTDDVPAKLPASGSSSITAMTPTASITMVTGTVPPPYDPVSVRNLEHDGNAEEDYLWLSHCQSHIRPPLGSSTSLETDYNDNLYPPPSTNSSSSSSSSSSPSLLPNGLPLPSSSSSSSSSGFRAAPWTVTSMTSPLSQSLDASMTSDLQRRAHRARCHPSPHPRKHSLDFHLRPVVIPLSDDTHSAVHPNTHSNTTSVYQIPRPASAVQPRPPLRRSSTPCVDSLTQLHASTTTPPPRPPKPQTIPAQGEGSGVGTRSATLPRSTSEAERRDGYLEGGLPRSNTITTSGRTHTGCDTFHVPRSMSHRASMFEFSESFSSYFFNKGMVPLSSVCSEDDDVDENYVPMSAATTEPPVAPRVHPHPPSDSSVQLQDANYVPMTPLTPSLPVHPTPATGDLASLGRQVPPPAHLGFRNSPLTPDTPPLRRNTVKPEVKAMPPPIHRNLKPQRRGVCQPAERTDIQTAGESTHKTRGKPPPLDITPVQQDWQEVPPPVRSPVTRTFTRDPSTHRTARPPSAHSSSPSSDSDDTDDSYVAMTTTPNLSFSTDETSLRLMLHRASEGGVSSPLLRRARGDKQVEYLDLDLHTGRSTPTRQKRCTAEGGGGGGSEQAAAGEERARGGRTRVDYVVVDPKRTKALRSTREAWHDGRMSTEKEKC
ncbi:hypothetical protein EPR50_G00195010 [Perca flavescens]|uniref:PH domain-containing protein n=1 Tax=Perca flavescens TaxID=8167 RepID=A0A484C657_PERFV|nr:GRB2-associated-binding protein 1-like [Perca flavescens]TDG99468.1 hypothetical protein EPR50_G00195010 [Perca flavescens]